MKEDHGRKLHLLVKVLLAITFGLFRPGVFSAEGPRAVEGAMDAWRTRLSERLENDLVSLSAAPPTGPQIPSRIKENSEEGSFPLASFCKRGIQRRGATWTPALVAMLREQGLPAGLVGMSAVESGFDPAALSSKGALGLWQLMPETARRYGLVVSPQLDERLDPIKSTYAAAQYMKDLYVQFQDWSLALAAYNAGEDRVERALKRLGARDFWTLSRQRALPEETRRYVPAVLAGLDGPLPPLPYLSPSSSNSYRSPVSQASAQTRVVFAFPSPKLAN